MSNIHYVCALLTTVLSFALRAAAAESEPISNLKSLSVSTKPIGFTSESVVSDSNKFDTKQWLEPPGQWSSRLDKFGRFLRDYDVIGMKKEKLVSLLGQGHLGKGGFRHISMHTEAGTVAYELFYGCDLNSNLRVKFHFRDDTVDRWNFFNAVTQGDKDNDSPAITTNVILAPIQQHNEWPTTVPK